MSGAFVLVWISCQPTPAVGVTINGNAACYEVRRYFDTSDACAEAQHALPKDRDGLQPLISVCAPTQPPEAKPQ